MSTVGSVRRDSMLKGVLEHTSSGLTMQWQREELAWSNRGLLTTLQASPCPQVVGGTSTQFVLSVD